MPLFVLFLIALDNLHSRIKTLDEDIEKILMERINDKENRQIYDNMLAKRREEKADCITQIENIKNIDITIQKRKSEVKQSIELIDEIIKSGGISNTHLRMLVEEIIINDSANGLQISIELKAPFRKHLDIYNDNNEVNDKIFESVVGGGWDEKVWNWDLAAIEACI